MTKSSRTFLRRIKRKKFGELLLSQGSITPEQLEESLQLQGRDGGLLGEIMVHRGFITENEVVRSLSTQYGLPVLRVNDYEIDKDISSRFTPEILYVNLMLPLSELSDLLLVTVADLPESEIIDTLEEIARQEIVFYLSSATEIADALTRLVVVSDDEREQYVSLRRRRGGQNRAKLPDARPAASEKPAPLPAERKNPSGGQGESVFTEIDNAWESIFDEAEQNIRREGL